VSICLLDTSILCELLEIPDRCQNPEEISTEFAAKREGDETLLLPMSAIIETGNHIGHLRNGGRRRTLAEIFIRLVQQAIRGESPFTSTPFFETEALLAWLDDFPDWVNQSSGLADLTIKKEFDRQCQLNRMRRVYIWSLDRYLSSYDRRPR